MKVKELIQAEIDKLSEDNLYDLYEIIKQFTQTNTQKKERALSKLKTIKIQAPEDFSENLDLYLTGEK